MESFGDPVPPRLSRAVVRSIQGFEIPQHSFAVLQVMTHWNLHDTSVAVCLKDASTTLCD